MLRPFTALKLSLRLPPNVEAHAAGARLKALLEDAPPYGARVTMTVDKCSTGWDAPVTASWLANGKRVVCRGLSSRLADWPRRRGARDAAVRDASLAYFGKPACFEGGGGSIPFMAMLGAKFPKAQFVVTGALGPKSNAHGPNEFLSIPMAKGVTSCVANVIHAHYEANK